MDLAPECTESSITLGLMPQQTEVRRPNDDWTGVTSTAERRKLQNRLNQRAYRRRKNELRDRSTSGAANHPGTLAGTEIDRSLIALPQNGFYPVSEKMDRPSNDRPARLGCTMYKPLKQTQFLGQTEEALAEYVTGTLRPIRLPSLVSVNIFNALARNAATLRISKEWLEEEAISPFNLHGPGLGQLFIELSLRGACLDSLRPTALQLSVPHHPWIDLLPIPRLRDNILNAIEDPNICDEDILCYDMVEVNSEHEKPCLIVWGESWDPHGWEASVAFLRKWGWLLKGCPEILQATNYWRQKRGETRLVFQK